MPQDKNAFLNKTINGKNRDKGFVPKAKAHSPAQPSQELAPQTDDISNDTDHAMIAQSEALTVRDSGGMTANAESQGIKALATRRESIQDAMAAELARLTDPDIFHAEVMAKAAERIRTRDQKRGQVEFELDFFDVSSVTASLPKPYQLPQAKQPKQLSNAG